MGRTGKRSERNVDEADSITVDSVRTRMESLAKKGCNLQPVLKTMKDMNVTLQDTSVNETQLLQLYSNISTIESRFKFSTGWQVYALVVYELSWLLLLAAYVIPHRYHVYIYFRAPGIDMTRMAIVAVIAGSIGAVLTALGALYRHRIHSDLDPSYALWYLLKPVVGGATGGLVGLATNILLTGVGSTAPSSVILISVLGALGGMNEGFALGVFQKLANQILGSSVTTKSPQSPGTGPQ